MRIKRVLTIGTRVVGALSIALAATACGGSDSGDSTSALDHVRDGKLTIGVKFDQPGLSMQDENGVLFGYDVEIAKYVANKLGVQADGISYTLAPSGQREEMLEKGAVDIVVGTYSITDERRQRVDFAGPYFTAGQSLLARADSNDITDVNSLTGDKKLCSVAGSTAAQNVKDNYAKDVQLQEMGGYSDCVEALRAHKVDAVTTDDIILAGFAGQTPGELKLVGNTFSVENYGIGVKKGDDELRGKINDAIEAMIADGTWLKTFEKEIGPLGNSTLTPPAIDRY